MRYEIWGDDPDPTQYPCYCPECAWTGIYEDCPDREDRGTIFVCPDCGNRVTDLEPRNLDEETS